MTRWQYASLRDEAAQSAGYFSHAQGLVYCWS